MSIKVFIVDTSSVARAILANILETDESIEIVGESGTYEGGIIMLDEVEPDIVMLEVHAGSGMSPDDAIREIKKIRPQTKVIVCTSPQRTRLVISAAKAGADDFIEKPYKAPRVLRVVHDAMKVGSSPAQGDTNA